MKFASLETLALAWLGVAALVPATAATTAPVVLSQPHLSTYVRQIAPVAGGRLCIVGQAMDPDGDLQSRGTVTLYSLAEGKVLWQQAVAAPDGQAASRFIACGSDGRSLYVAANVDSHSERSLNRAQVYLYRFDDQGRVAAVKPLATGSGNAFVYALGADAGGVTVSGMTNDVKAGRQANAIFFARVDPLLKEARTSRVEKGAFASGASARLADGALHVAGNFLPASDAADALADDYAVSKIVAGKYQFSLRPVQAKAEDIATTVTAAADVVSLAVVGKSTTLTVVGPDGKLKDSRTLASTFCQTGSISATAGTVYAIRSPCGRSQDPARLVAIARPSGAEAAVAGISGEPVNVLALEDRLVVVTRKSNGSLLLHTLPLAR
ncbi:hypothetical protein IP91_03399 [Pseudoduganella lurida]|uniref:PQQ-binding-like beta-propeller repeat protein n=1 Tax=Pseudoduganella lurida TaxID=1036180 RepID=A0A562R2Y7_9BURK|nr:hypothetical protein [Pseudoduganella lurida]TWI63429.1 hypothetical protein IP91_03399 [Pseudoduganella lurida]